MKGSREQNWDAVSVKTKLPTLSGAQDLLVEGVQYCTFMIKAEYINVSTAIHKSIIPVHVKVNLATRRVDKVY